MFEFRDKNLGSLKFISVSEARAKFADCLKEDACNIVVTRHGVPYKVFVSYEEYMALKNAAQANGDAAVTTELQQTAAPVASSPTLNTEKSNFVS